MRALDPRLLQHAAAARRFVLVAVAIAVGTAVLVMVQAELLADVIDRAFLAGAGLSELYPLLVAVAVAVLARAVLAWGSEVAAHRASARVIRQLRTKLVEHVLRLGPRHREFPATSALAPLATRGLDGLDGYFSRYLPTLLIAAIVPAMIAGRILFADWVSGLIVALTMPLIPVFMVLIGLQTERSTKRQWRKLAALGNHFLDIVSGLDALVAFGRAGRQRERLRTIAESYRATTMRTLRVAFLSALTLELLATLSVAVVAVAIGLRLVAGQMDLATGLLVLILAPEVYLPLRAVGTRFHESAEGLVAAGEVFAVLETPASGAGEDGRRPPPDPSRMPVHIRNVTITGRAGPVLDGLDLTIAPGETLGVRGPSGVGKSTLLDVLLGFRTPDAGRVEVGGTDLADLDRAAWLSRVAWVPQRPVLVAGTVADNIRLGAEHAATAEVRAAADVVALDVPLDAPVGEGGAGLSTGQLRRVALARAVLADRPLLLLDEPTEGVDPAAEAVILDGLRRVFAGRTAVVVSHRGAVLRACDRVVELRAPAATPAAQAGDQADTADGRPDRRPAQPAQPAQPEEPDAPPPPGPAGRAGPANRRALGWVLSAARGQGARLGLAVLLGSAALGCGVALTATSAWLISAAALQPPVFTLAVAIAAVRAFGIGKGVLRYSERLVSHDAALRVLTTLRLRIWQALVRLGPAVTARLRRGELLSRLIGDVDAQQDVLVRVLIPYASAAVVGVAVSLGLGMLLPAAGVVVAVGLAVAGILAPAIAVLAAHAAERRTAAARGLVTAQAVELLGAAPDLIAFGAAERYRHALADADAGLSRLLGRSAVARGLGSGITVLAIGCTAVAATAFGIVALRDGSLAGTVLAVLALTPLAAAELVAVLPDAALRLTGALPASRRLAELESMPSAVAEPAHSAGVPAPRTLAARELAVRWPQSSTDVVSGVRLTLAEGDRLALTGPSGAGKSTVIAALMRTLDPSAGAVLADGRDARELTGDELRRGIAWCGPWTHLFDSSLRANLLIARAGADDDELAAALRGARLGDWLAGLPEGLDTRVGRHSGAVSGGERQRIGIARALLADRPVLLLDEPTAHLDGDTAAALAAEVLAATEGRTALIVTHRPDQVPGLAEVRLVRNGQFAAR